MTNGLPFKPLMEIHPLLISVSIQGQYNVTAVRWGDSFVGCRGESKLIVTSCSLIFLGHTFDQSFLNGFRHERERRTFVCSGCQRQSFFHQIASSSLFSWYTYGRTECVSCQDNNSCFREDELILIQLEIASRLKLFWDK